MSLKLDRAREIVEKFPNTAKASLAVLLYKENPGLYYTVEDARLLIRRATGAQGDKNRKGMKATVKQSKFANGKINNPYDLPEQENNNYTQFIIPVNEKTKIGIIGDIHFPYQNNQALTCALDRLKKDKITDLYLNGDIIDCHELSTFEKDPNKRTFKYEIDLVRNFLKTLKTKFKGVRTYFKEGNHENRFMRFMYRKAPELLGFEAFSLPVLLGLKELGIEYISSSRTAKAGNITIAHGHEWGQQVFSPVNPARGAFVKAKGNIIVNHHHQCTSHSENTIDGKQLVAYSVGHLADPHPEYRPLNNYSHGFAEIDFSKTKNGLRFKVSNYKIIDGDIC